MKTIKILQQLIQIPSVSGEEGDILKWIFTYISELGFKPEWVGSNVVLKIGGKDSSKCLIFNGHVDTVPAGDESLWQHPPFAGEIQRGKLYGLGASDMKSGDALMLSLIEKYSKEVPSIDLWFHFVIQEETDGAGTGEVMQWFHKNHQREYKQVGGIIGEATGNQDVRIGHKGNIFLKVTTKGQSGHGSKPHQVKHHAVADMYEIAGKLEALVKGWTQEHTDELLGSPSIALFTSFSAGSLQSPNKIPDTAIATFDIRTTPSIHYKAVDIIKDMLAGKRVNIDLAYEPLPYGYTNKDEYIIKVAQKVTKLPLGVNVGSNDLLFFTKYSIACIILGPGTPKNAHSQDEFIEIENLDIYFDYYIKIIEEF